MIFTERKVNELIAEALTNIVESRTVPVKVERVDPHAIVPTYAHNDDACCDLYIIEDYTIRSGQRMLLRTGIAIEIPTGYEVQLRPRSGLAWKNGLTLVNAPGTVDAQYRNEVKILIVNLGRKPVSLKRGDRAAQMCIKPVYTMKFTEVDKLSESDRGQGGWGSTGK